ncbi:MAG: pantothenate kinase [Bacteroidetes bacterium]|nr:MAG: pantothenate kinase [Bacteroidota bacterium]PTM11807.1 MAG: pantothenate kinase [Bacteroidota bacterium]
MHNLVIDIGNTRVKYGLFSSGVLVDKVVVDQLSLSDILQLATNHRVENIIYSSVSNWLAAPEAAILQNRYRIMELAATTPLPITLGYTTPATLGKDRLAAVVGAWSCYPGQDCLVVDAGTCITTDFLRADGHYLGGNIAPGIRLRLRAMHEFTARLPLVEPGTWTQNWGTSTTTALQNGGWLGAALEIEALAVRQQREWPDLKVLITGGDAEILAKRIEYKIFVHSNLVLLGLNKILTYNVE